MSRERRAVTVRTVLLLVGATTLAYILVASAQLTRVLNPAASALRGRASDLLSDHDAIAENQRRMRIARRDLARHVPPFAAGAAPPRPLEELREEVRTLLDSATAVGPRVERSELPAAMRLLLAEAVAEETAFGLDLMRAIRSVALGRAAEAVGDLRTSGVHSDSSAVLLSMAQRAALGSLLEGENRLLGELQWLDRWSRAWALSGVLLFALGVWFVHRRLYRPVRRMEEAVRRVADGDLAAEVEIDRADELGRLGMHLNAMTAVLRERALDATRERATLVARFGRLLDESSNEICVFDATSLRAVQANRGALRGLGYAADEVGSITLPQLLAQHDALALRAHLDALRSGRQDRVFLTTRQTRKDGTTYPVEMTLQFSRDGEAGVFLTVAEEAGMRQRARALDERLREFALAQQRVLGSGDLSLGLGALTAMAADALDAARVSVWRTDGVERRHLASSAPDGPTDATARPLEVPVQVNAKDAALLVIEAGDAERDWTPEERTFAGAVASFVARVLDAHERRALEQALARAQRLESIGQLAGGVAHDFNNILTAILGNLEVARLELAPGDPADALLVEAEAAARRAADLTRQLLTFARHQPVEARVFDPNALAREADRMLRRLVGAHVELRSELSPDLRTIRMGTGQFEQVLVNLVVNARDAMPDGGVITVRTRNVDVTARAGATSAGPGPGRYIELSVQDTGVGMDPETLERVFEPFFTTKGPGEGTGLGLAVCYGIVEQIGGSISAVSARGKGTTFRVLLPAADEVSEPPASPWPRRSQGGHETILVVEDERPIRDLITRALMAHGYTVLTAADGEEALRVVATHPTRIDLLVSDVVMPGMGGPALARALRERFPWLQVLLMSGYTADALRDGEVPQGAVFVAKPFSPDDLARRVRDLLDPAGAGSPA
ncbi:MAG: response regulator [Gemmatimonadales bacterium]|nr:response regulator [Gemmatimonadales bacterium]